MVLTNQLPVVLHFILRLEIYNNHPLRPSLSLSNHGYNCNKSCSRDLKIYCYLAITLRYVFCFSELGVPVLNGSFDGLAVKVREFVKKNVDWCKPKALWICDGSEEEDHKLREALVKDGVIRSKGYVKIKNKVAQ